MTVRPAKTQISLGICPVWSETSLCKLWVAMEKGPKLSLSRQWRLWWDWADDQADLSLCQVHSLFCWFCRTLAQILTKAPYNIQILFTNILKLNVSMSRKRLFLLPCSVNLTNNGDNASLRATAFAAQPTVPCRKYLDTNVTHWVWYIFRKFWCNWNA